MILFLLLFGLALSVIIFGAVKLHLILSSYGPRKCASIVCFRLVTFDDPRLRNNKRAYDLVYAAIRAYMKVRGWPL